MNETFRSLMSHQATRREALRLGVGLTATALAGRRRPDANAKGNEMWTPRSDKSRAVNTALEANRDVVIVGKTTDDYVHGRKNVRHTQDTYVVVPVERTSFDPSSLLGDVEGIRTMQAEPVVNETGTLVPGRFTTIEITNPGVMHSTHPENPENGAQFILGREIHRTDVEVFPTIQAAQARLAPQG